MEWFESPELLQSRLSEMAKLSQEFSLNQCVFLVSENRKKAQLLADLMTTFGTVRGYLGNKTILLEIRRPEGFVISVLPGAFYQSAVTDPEAIDLKSRFNEFSQPSEATALERSPLLSRLILQACDGHENPLYQHLIKRQLPLVVMTDAQRRIQPKSWPGGGSAIPVYTDKRSVFQTAQDLGQDKQSIAMAAFSTRELFAMALKQNTGLALCAFDDKNTPRYFVLHCEIIASLIK